MHVTMTRPWVNLYIHPLTWTNSPCNTRFNDVEISHHCFPNRRNICFAPMLESNPFLNDKFNECAYKHLWPQMVVFFGSNIWFRVFLQCSNKKITISGGRECMSPQLDHGSICTHSPEPILHAILDSMMLKEATTTFQIDEIFSLLLFCNQIHSSNESRNMYFLITTFVQRLLLKISLKPNLASTTSEKQKKS